MSRLRVPSYLTTAIADIELRKQKAAQYVYHRDYVVYLRSNRRRLIDAHGLTDVPTPKEPDEEEEENVHNSFGRVMEFAMESEDDWDRRVSAIRGTRRRVVDEFFDLADWIAMRQQRLRWEYERVFHAGPWA
jgi:hypothetical protein